MLIFIGFFTVLFCESRSYPYPITLPVPLPSASGIGAEYEVSVDLNGPVYGVPNIEFTNPGYVNYGTAAGTDKSNHHGYVSYGTSGGPDARNQILTPLAGLSDAVDNKIKQAVTAASIQIDTPFPDSGRQHAILESAAKETIPIQADIKYGNLQQLAANFYHPKPIVDTIQEHEKYGNDGGKIRAFGTVVVGAFEGLSNALNTLVDVPFQAVKTIGRQVTTTLNQVGGKLVGLA